MFRAGGETSAHNVGDRKRLHTTFPDGSELIEEYDLKTGELLLRKRRQKTTLGRLGAWESLFGQMNERTTDASVLSESSSNPVLSRQDTSRSFQWRIRNLPYPKDVYNVTIEDRNIVIRTSNKKYFKRITVPEMDHMALPMQQDALTWTHANNTLIVAYVKPHAVLEAEAREIDEVKRFRAQTEGDVGCKQQ